MIAFWVTVDKSKIRPDCKELYLSMRGKIDRFDFLVRHKLRRDTNDKWWQGDARVREDEMTWTHPDAWAPPVQLGKWFGFPCLRNRSE